MNLQKNKDWIYWYQWVLQLVSGSPRRERTECSSLLWWTVSDKLKSCPTCFDIDKLMCQCKYQLNSFHIESLHIYIYIFIHTLISTWIQFMSYGSDFLATGFSLNKAEQRCGICGALGHLGFSAAAGRLTFDRSKWGRVFQFHASPKEGPQRSHFFLPKSEFFSLCWSNLNVDHLLVGMCLQVAMSWTVDKLFLQLDLTELGPDQGFECPETNNQNYKMANVSSWGSCSWWT